MTEDYAAAQTYHEATGTWPEGFVAPEAETDAQRQEKAARAYYDATGHWPGEKPKNVKQEEAPEDAFSHYLELASGQTVRFAAHPRNPSDIPNAWNGVPVVRVHNAFAPGSEESE